MDLNIKRLLRDLANPDEDLRTLAAMTLVKIEIPDPDVRTKVLEALRGATHDKNISVRFFARKALGRFKDESALEDTRPALPLSDLHASLASDDFEERIAALMKIGQEKKVEHKDHLVAMLKSETNEFVRATLVSTLGGMLGREEAAVLSGFLNDPDGRVRSNTIEALERIGADEAIPSLFPCLEDPDNRIRAAAAKALSSFGEGKVFAVLRKMLQAAEEWMKSSAIYALSHIRAGESIQLLIETATSAPPDTRVKAIVALANFHDLTVHGFLKHTTTQAEPMRSAAAKALKLIEEKFGGQVPASTIVKEQPLPEGASGAGVSGKASIMGRTGPRPGGAKKPAEKADLASTVTQFFRKGKDEATAPLSGGAQVRFSLTDVAKEQEELAKEAGRVVFEMYQRGDVKLSELLTLCHEVLRMNFFIQKYSEEEKKEQAETGFFANLKNMFSRAPEKKKQSDQVDRYNKKKDEIFLQLGKRAFSRMDDPEDDFRPLELEGFHKTWQRLADRVRESQAPKPSTP